MNEHQHRRFACVIVCGLGLVVAGGGCAEFFANQTASLGGEQGGGRGNIRVLFINNTDHRAVFTYGTYDQFDVTAEPDFAQFSAEVGGRELAGGERSTLFASDTGSTLACGRVFSVGSRRLIGFVEASDPDGTVFDDALAEGVTFLDESDATAGPLQVGAADPLEALLGVDFPCGALLIVRLEPDVAAPRAFRIAFEIIPSESTR